MINIETLLSSFDERGTLLKWLKAVEKALNEATLTSVDVIVISTQQIQLQFNFEDGTHLTTPAITLPKGEKGDMGEKGDTGETGEQGVGISNIAINDSDHLIVTLTNGVQIDAGQIDAGSGIVVDTELSPTSENPVQNKVIYTTLAGKQDTIDSTHKLSADNVDDTNSTNKFVSASDKTTWNEKQDPLNTSTVEDGTINKLIGFDVNGDIVKALPQDKLFVATYNVTTISEVVTALNNGKVVCCYKDGELYICTHKINISAVVFTLVYDINNELVMAGLGLDTGGWVVYQSKTLQTKLSASIVGDGTIVNFIGFNNFGNLCKQSLAVGTKLYKHQIQFNMVIADEDVPFIIDVFVPYATSITSIATFKQLIESSTQLIIKYGINNCLIGIDSLSGIIASTINTSGNGIEKLFTIDSTGTTLTIDAYNVNGTFVSDTIVAL